MHHLFGLNYTRTLLYNQYGCHKFLDPLPLKTVTTFMDDSKISFSVLLRTIAKVITFWQWKTFTELSIICTKETVFKIMAKSNLSKSVVLNRQIVVHFCVTNTQLQSEINLEFSQILLWMPTYKSWKLLSSILCLFRHLTHYEARRLNSLIILTPGLNYICLV